MTSIEEAIRSGAVRLVPVDEAVFDAIAAGVTVTASSDLEIDYDLPAKLIRLSAHAAHGRAMAVFDRYERDGDWDGDTIEALRRDVLAALTEKGKE